MRYRLQRHDGTDCSATMVPITVLRMVPIQRYRQLYFYLQYLYLFLTFYVLTFEYIIPLFEDILQSLSFAYVYYEEVLNFQMCLTIV